MNQTIQELFDRKSVRAFTDQPILPEERDLIIEAAAIAPTAGNQQLYTILEITDQDLKEQLAESCDHQPFIAKAGLVLIFCADCRKWYRAFEAAGCAPRPLGVGDLMLAVTDTAIAAQNAVTAAESMGIGSCYIGDIMENCEVHKKMLHLPDHVLPAVMLVFGYPTEQQKQRPKPERAAMKHIVHPNTYRDMKPGELREMLEYKAGHQTYEAWIKAFCDRKYNSDFSVEMTRSIAEYLKEYEK